MPTPYRAVVITVSDSVAKGEREDASGPAVKRQLEESGFVVSRPIEVAPDDFTLIRERLSALATDPEVDAIFTTGGTGVSPRDRTPEATTSTMERSIPGLAELMRLEGGKNNRFAALSRAVVGMKGKTLLVNLPGSPEGAVDSLAAIVDLLPHALAVIRGEEVHERPAKEAVAVAEPAPAEAPEEPEAVAEVAAPAEPSAEASEPVPETSEAPAPSEPAGGASGEGGESA